MKKIMPSKRTENVTYAIRDVVIAANKLQAQGKQILNLNIGDPNIFDFDTPEHMKEAVIKAMKDGHNGYSPANGTKEAIQAIRNEAERKGIKNIQEIFVSTGASEAIELCITGLLDTGDNILIPSPGYPLYSAVTAKLETIGRSYYLNEENEWQIDIEALESRITERTRGIIVINPNNPTGGLYTKETLLQVIELARKHNLVIFSDEIYDKLTFDGEKHISTASLADDVPILTMNGISKSYVAPGWRLGWAIMSGPKEIIGDYIEGVMKMVRARLCANHPEQYAIKPALEGPQNHIPINIAKMQERRDLTFKRLNEIKHLSCVKPKGAFYAFPKINLDIDDREFTMKLLEETQVLVVFGSGFGQKPGTAHFRVVFLPQMDVLAKSYDKLEEFMNKYYA
jgi:alanine-synthesizing transaminase